MVHVWSKLVVSNYINEWDLQDCEVWGVCLILERQLMINSVWYGTVWYHNIWYIVSLERASWGPNGTIPSVEILSTTSKKNISQ